MRRIALLLVCSFVFAAKSTTGQTTAVKPIHVPAGSIITFYLQTRLNPADGNAIDLLPKGTVLNIKVLDTIDSDLTRDGAAFRGVVVAPLVSKDDVIIHADAEVRGLFALLRSRNHPDGFRYELLITGIADGGKLFQLTASMNPSFQDPTLIVQAKARNNTNAPSSEKPSQTPSGSARE